MADAERVSRLDESIADYMASGDLVGQTTWADINADAAENDRVAVELEAAGNASAAETARADAAEAREIVRRRDRDAALQYAQRHCLVGKLDGNFTGFATEVAPTRLTVFPIRCAPRPREKRAPVRRTRRLGTRRGRPRRSEDDPEPIARGVA
jgi:hypothetical protein